MGKMNNIKSYEERLNELETENTYKFEASRAR